MKIGDMVKKVKGDLDRGKLGQIVKLEIDSMKTEMLTVMILEAGQVPELKTWPKSLVEVVGEVS